MTTYPDDEDGAVLADLASQGVDMSRPILIDFAIAVPDEETAIRVEHGLAGAWYEVETYFDEGEPDEDGEIDRDSEEFGPAWTVYAKIQMVPAYPEIMSTQATLAKLVAPLGGELDGWGTMVE